MSSALEREWTPYSPCPCGCPVIAGKLSLKAGHVRGCSCSSCRNRNNRSRGQRGEARTHRRLGGKGFTPKDEMGHLYSIDVVCQVKTGAQVGKALARFVDGEFFRHAMSQAERSKPVGVDAFPSVVCELSPSRAYLIADISGKGLRG